MIRVRARRAGGLPPAVFSDDRAAINFAKALESLGVFPVIDNGIIDWDTDDDV